MHRIFANKYFWLGFVSGAASITVTIIVIVSLMILLPASGF